MFRITALAFCGLIIVAATGCAHPGPVKIMSWQPQGSPSDVATRIGTEQPDIAALQCVAPTDAAQIEQQLPGYQLVAAASIDGQQRGEMVPILVRKSRFNIIGDGHFWLSETPGEVGSKSWGAQSPGMATWVRLRYKDTPLKELQIMNVQFDRDCGRVRLQQAKLVRDVVESLSGRPMVVVGDFRCDRGSAPYTELTEDRQTQKQLEAPYLPESVGPRVDALASFGHKAAPGTADFGGILYNCRIDLLDLDDARGPTVATIQMSRRRRPTDTCVGPYCKPKFESKPISARVASR
jgi:endonuclease/exonuclease/phosphatase family metal-dependent hydrolase